MNELTIFENPEFGSVRTTMVDDEPWFVGKDVATALGYERPDNAIRIHVDDEDKLMHQISASGQNRNMTIINESGLYSLIFGSKLESAKKFKRWVTSEVLPAIRKTGIYAVPQSRQRDLTKDDYLKAAHIVAGCRNERLPYVLNFLENAGFCVPDVQEEPCVVVEDDGINLVRLLNRYSLRELCEKLKIPRTSLYFYRTGRYKPLPDRRKYIIETLE